MFRSDFTLHLWGAHIGVQAALMGIHDERDFIEVTLLLPEKVHRQFLGEARPPQLITEGEKASPFVFDDIYDQETSSYAWTARLTPLSGRTFSLVRLNNSYASWQVEGMRIRLTWKEVGR